ncbi:MAG: 50S ribosomal protein L16, partial [Phycisphaerales bacterium]|nr:50S ribosomal protein L16 [Phycisphaerales bacterium]
MPPYKIPKRVKFRKEFRRVRDRKATKGNYVAFGDFGLQALEGCWLKSNQIEAGRIASTHFLKRQGKLFIRVFPDKPVSKKPAETRMGKGKGNPELWVAPIKRGRILYEMEGVNPEIAREA